MAKLPKVLVIILSWNRQKDTIETLKSLSKSNVKGFEMEILVVDNASTDNTVAKVKKLFPHVRTIVNYKNLGFAEGNNIGMKYGLEKNFDYIALLNNDTIVDKNLVQKIFNEHQKDKKAGAISPKIYFAKGFEFHRDKYKTSELGKVIWYAGGLVDWDNVYGSNRGVDEVDNGQFEIITETDFTTGCFVMYKRQVLKEVGLYDKRYFLYMEDLDHSQRIKQASYKVLYCPAGAMWHKVSQSSAIGSDLNDYYITRNRMLFGMTYAQLRTKFALIRESISLLLNGREWQKVGIRDFYLQNFGKGSWI
jgi:GT2 family glycosyltransferase